MRGKGKVHTQGILDGTQEDFNILWVLYLLEDTMRIPLVWRRWLRATSWIWYRCRGDSSAAFLGLIIVTAIIWFQIWHTLSILKQHYCGTEMPSTLSDQTLFTEKWNPTAKKKKKRSSFWKCATQLLFAATFSPSPTVSDIVVIYFSTTCFRWTSVFSVIPLKPESRGVFLRLHFVLLQ